MSFKSPCHYWQNLLQGGAPAYAALTSAMGVGSVIGAFYTANRTKVSLSLLIRAAILMGLSMLFGLCGSHFKPSNFCHGNCGNFFINLTSLGNVILQTESPPFMRGRVMALWAVVFLGSIPYWGADNRIFRPAFGATVGNCDRRGSGHFGRGLGASDLKKSR